MKERIEFSESGDSIKNWVVAMRGYAGPPHKPVGKLEEILAAAFVETQAATHILTGSLKASGKTDTDFDGDVWEGSITYGGVLWRSPFPGPANDPVDYAIYEMARGGDHDFFAPLTAFDGAVSHVLQEWFKG